jgi:DNA replication protein DnaC
MSLLQEIDRKTPEQMQKILSYAKNPKGFLLLAGDNGVGKSFVAKAIYEAHATYKLPYYDMDEAFFINQADLNEKWLNAKNENSAMELSNRLKKTKLLVLDDLGTKAPSDAFADFLYAIIDYRWNHKDSLGTIITTNMTGKITRERFGDPILSRIASGINIRFTQELNGEDRRVIDF